MQSINAGKWKNSNGRRHQNHRLVTLLHMLFLYVNLYVRRIVFAKMLNIKNVFRIKGVKKFFSVKAEKLEGFTEKPDPHLIKHDYIGPPDKESNLRLYIRCIRKDESPLDTKLRNKQIEVQEWNQLFWSRHNKRFYDEKEEFIKIHKQCGIHDISADKLSEFYKSFLDKNLKIHILYNMSWYLKNFEMLVLAFQVAVRNVYRKLKI